MRASRLIGAVSTAAAAERVVHWWWLISHVIPVEVARPIGRRPRLATFSAAGPPALRLELARGAYRLRLAQACAVGGLGLGERRRAVEPPCAVDRVGVVVLPAVVRRVGLAIAVADLKRETSKGINSSDSKKNKSANGDDKGPAPRCRARGA